MRAKVVLICLLVSSRLCVSVTDPLSRVELCHCSLRFPKIASSTPYRAARPMDEYCARNQHNTVSQTGIGGMGSVNWFAFWVCVAGGGDTSARISRYR